MAQGLDRRGKFYNSTSPDEVNRGVYGKFTSEQLEERKELHARRIHCGMPTVQSIVDHFKIKHGLSIHYQSEKEWALRDKNRAAILAKKEAMLRNGELEVDTLSNQTLLNSLSQSARAEAAIVNSLKHKTGMAIKGFDADLKPWSVLGIPKEKYYKASPEQLGEWKPKLDIELTLKREILAMLATLSKVLRDHSEEVRKTVKVAYDLAKDMNAENISSEKSYKLKQAHKERLQAEKQKVLAGSEEIDYMEIDIDALRKETEDG